MRFIGTIVGVVKELGMGHPTLGVCLLACIVPTRRALSVEPTVALRED